MDTALQGAWPYLLHVVQVLHARRLPQVDAMSYVLAQHEGTHQMVCISSLSCSIRLLFRESLEFDLAWLWGIECQLCFKQRPTLSQLVVPMALLLRINGCQDEQGVRAVAFAIGEWCHQLVLVSCRPGIVCVAIAKTYLTC